MFSSSGFQLFIYRNERLSSYFLKYMNITVFTNKIKEVLENNFSFKILFHLNVPVEFPQSMPNKSSNPSVYSSKLTHQMALKLTP